MGGGRKAPIAIGLTLQELPPGERARVVDHLTWRVRLPLNDPHQARVELAKQVRHASRAAWQPPRAASYEQVLRGAAGHH